MIVCKNLKRVAKLHCSSSTLRLDEQPTAKCVFPHKRLTPPSVYCTLWISHEHVCAGLALTRAARTTTWSNMMLHGNAQLVVVDLHAAGIANTEASMAEVSKVDWS